MNRKFLLEQWVNILRCDILIVGMDCEIRESYGGMPREMNPLCTDPAFLCRLMERKEKDYPDIYCEKQAVLYAVIPLEQEKVIMGPVNVAGSSNELDDFMIRTHFVRGTAAHMVPCCELKLFGAGVLALYHVFTEREMTAEDLWEKNGLQGMTQKEARSSVQKIIFSRQENGIPHNPYDQERRELDSIRRGDREMLRLSLGETYRGEVGRLSHSEIRQARNIAICVITLASRAAIEGGVLPEEAFSMADGFIQKIEELTNIVQIDGAMRQAEYEFADEVSKRHEKPEKNELIEKTKNYIFQNLHGEIRIGEIGKQIGVSSTYLSDLFHRVEGMTIRRYIRREKVRLAESLLRYSEYSVKDIANYLAFSSQSHLGRIFKEETGMTPAKYRQKYRFWHRNENT